MSRPWVYDLDSASVPRSVTVDVCIIGGGPVGLTAARALAERGVDVLLLEAGSERSTMRPLAGVRFDRRAYRGATIGRGVGLGGTSCLWGGQLLPVRAADLAARPQIGAPAWPLDHDALAPHLEAVLHWLEIDPSGFELASLQRPGHALLDLDYRGWTPRMTKWIAFAKRNLGTAWSETLRHSPHVRVCLNGSPRSWRVSHSGGGVQISELIARSRGGHELTIRPRSVIIAAGGLESARLVLELNASAGSLSSGVEAHAGRFLHDHLSVRLARVRVIDWGRFQALFAPPFEGPTMRSFRLELAPEVLAREALPAFYAQFLFETTNASGFAVIRDGLRAAQRGQAGAFARAALRVPRALPGIASLAYARYARRCLPFPSDSEIYLHVDFEQAPRAENRVYLESEGADSIVHIDWDLEPETPRIAASVRRLFSEFWCGNRLDRIAELEFLDLGPDPNAWSHNVHDLYHPAGTTRMARDPQNGVVDEELRIHGTDNAYVAGSSVFPSMGAANPTFTAMALAHRLATRLHRSA